jgi:hypothetical protein
VSTAKAAALKPARFPHDPNSCPGLVVGGYNRGRYGFENIGNGVRSLNQEGGKNADGFL